MLLARQLVHVVANVHRHLERVSFVEHVLIAIGGVGLRPAWVNCGTVFKEKH
jgi:hypothetical protein